VEAREKRVAAAERVRALYVAMTRARDRLVLLGSWPLAGGGKLVARESLMELLRSRREPPAPLADSMLRARAEGRDAELGANGVRWVFPELRGALPTLRPPENGEDERSDLADFHADLRRLGAWREAGQRRMQRSFRAAASADAHAEERERRVELGPGRETAAAAGTAVHRVLEQLRLDGEPREELARASAGLAAWIDALIPGGERAAALASAREALARFADGPLLERFAGLRGAVIARELPVLLRPDPEGEGAVGFVAGSIDLLYRDPASGELVIADYKSDRVEGAAALTERAQRYQGQATHYRRAVQEALELPAPPRFELWFLYAGVVVPVG
jgi:ATP-dependent exoDNAse (exonuclease V) beta subunit